MNAEGLLLLAYGSLAPHALRTRNKGVRRQRIYEIEDWGVTIAKCWMMTRGGGTLAAFLRVLVSFSCSFTSSPLGWRHVYVALVGGASKRLRKKSLKNICILEFISREHRW